MYSPKDIEPKWQKEWFSSDTFKCVEDKTKPKYYVLEMLPYPSGQLHMGHVRNYTLGDVLARFKRAAGFNVLHPMGWDSFGLPAENAALKRKIHPGEWTKSNIADMKTTMNQFGWSYDWSREVATCTPEYYGHQQVLFQEFINNGLAYRKESIVNWDPVENTVLANEQVVDGKGWRSGEPVERRTMHQWHFKITQYAQELLDDLNKLPEWPERVKTMQSNWLGRSEGVEFYFKMEGEGLGGDERLDVYTTRSDTIMGTTFAVLAPEHPYSKKLAETDAGARSFIEECQSMGTSEEAIERAEKKGYKTPYSVIHPLSGEKLPVYIGNFVIYTYGTGAIKCAPAHDQRDWDFATKYNLPIKPVVTGAGYDETAPYSKKGTVVNSGTDLDGLTSDEAISKVIELLEAKGVGKGQVNWRLRDWGVSRQRYWGCPIPVVHCEKCGIVNVPKNELPVELPKDVSFEETGNPLENHPTWKHTTCPTCNGKATRETDTMDTFVDSSWYFLRYICLQANVPLEKQAVDYWMGTKASGVDQYIGGIEHAVLHLLYARFFTKALRDMKYVSIDEPFTSLLCQGMVIGNSYVASSGEYIYPNQVEWKDSKAFHKQTGEELKVLSAEKISKSKNNGDAPDELIERYSADTLRLFILFTAPPERDLEWSEQAIEGSWRFLNRLYTMVEKVQGDSTELLPAETKEERALQRKIHQTIRKITADINSFHYNTMVAAIMELTNALYAVKDDATPAMLALRRFGAKMAVQLLNPACPHITEEMWQMMGETTHLTATNWPEYDETLAKDEEITLVVQVNGKLKAKLQVPADINEDEAKTQARAATQEHLAGLAIRKEIYVPGRLVNIVAN